MAVRWSNHLIEQKNSKSAQFEEVEGDLLTLIGREGMQERYRVNLAVQKTGSLMSIA